MRWWLILLLVPGCVDIEPTPDPPETPGPEAPPCPTTSVRVLEWDLPDDHETSSSGDLVFVAPKTAVISYINVTTDDYARTRMDLGIDSDRKMAWRLDGGGGLSNMNTTETYKAQLAGDSRFYWDLEGFFGVLRVTVDTVHCR